MTCFPFSLILLFLGDVPALTATPTKYLSAGTSLSVYDDVVVGEHPQALVLSDLDTGIPYYTRVQSYSRGPFHGYSNYSATDGTGVYSGIAAGSPPVLSGFSASPVLQVSEVQEIFVAASHQLEIQTVTTSATPFSEVQLVDVTSPEGFVVSGNFALRVPEVQQLQVRATGSTVLTGFVKLTYIQKAYGYGGTVANTGQTSVTGSTCISVTASASDVVTALESISTLIDTVEVVRNGYGGYKDYFGYAWDISFTGNMVAGNVQLLQVTGYGATAAACSASTSSADIPSALKFLVSSLNENQVVGTDSEIQTIVVSASTTVAQGSYAISLSAGTTQQTVCLAWNASASDMQHALGSLSNVDGVIVERFGDGTSATNYGYTYSVYFTGNSLHLRAGSGSELTLMTTTAATAASACTGGTSSPFAYFTNGILTNFPSTNAQIVVQRVRARGYTLPTGNTTAYSLGEALGNMPTFLQLYDTRRSIADDRLGYQYTMVFDVSMGNAPDLVCGMDSTLKDTMATCSHLTLVQGNYIGGYFIVGTSALFPSDVSAQDMELQLQLLQGFGNVSVTRTGPDFQGGYSWTLTWLTAIGNQPPLQFSNLLTGSGTTINGSTIQDGNYLGGNYTLSYNGLQTAAIPFDASAAVMTSALESIVDMVSVYRSPLTTEGGSSYLVTFLGLAGDVPLLAPQFQGTLSGAHAVVTVIENVKGALASGSSVKVSFQAPLNCSQSQVTAGECGSPVDMYSIQVGRTQNSVNQIVPLPASQQIQMVRISALSLFDPVYFSGKDATGYFRLSYNGVTTGPISSHASESSIRDALEALPDINTVAVTRTYSAELMQGTLVAIPGMQTLECADSCNINTLVEGDMIYVGGQWYKVSYLFNPAIASIPIAQVNDSSVIADYAGTNSSSISWYRWARGFEWSVTFLSVATRDITGAQLVLPLASPQHGLNVQDAAVSIRPKDCVDCAYISNLEVWSTYFLRLQAHNAMGFGGFATTTVMPQQIPGPPSSITANSVSGSQINVLFSPPSGNNPGIRQYTIQWDSNPLFSNVLTKTPSCASVGYGQCQIVGAAISVIPPYSYMIEYLGLNSRYYVRVAARNAVSVQMTDPTGSIADNTEWSETVSTVTSNQAPGAPVSVSAVVSGPSYLQIQVTPPVDNGGLNISSYIIEWDASADFNDPTTYGNVTVATSHLPILSSTTGVLIYEISNLVTGLSYWVRASAVNSIGPGRATMTGQSTTPAGKPGQPGSVQLVTAVTQNTPITSANVTWTDPVVDGGSPITGYLVEWWEGGSVPEVQVIQYITSTYPVAQVGQYSLSFGPVPGLVESVPQLSWSVTDFNLRSELVSLGYANSLAANFSSRDIIVGNLAVSRSVISGKGYQWAV